MGSMLIGLVATALAGCAEMHRGVEAVGRIGSSPATAEEAEAEPVSRPEVRTVRPRGAPRAPAAVAAAVPSPRQIFDFHPAGSRPDSWRQPFVIDTDDGPLAADVRRSAAELRAFLADRKAGDARAAQAAATRTDAAKADGTATGTTRKVCGEMDVATGKPGCVVPRPQSAAIR